MERRAIRNAALGLMSGLLLIQAVPSRPAEPAGKTGEPIEASLAVPIDVRHLFDRACANCHSAETRYPWYAKVAPVSWIIDRDIREARKSMDLSNWTGTSGETTGRTIGTLMAACASLQTGIMPPPSYRTMHPEARLSGQEIADFCAWTSTTARELRMVARGQSRLP